MSSILDALRKLEAPDVTGSRRPIRLEHEPRARPWWLLGLALAFGAGAGVALSLWRASVPKPGEPPTEIAAVTEAAPSAQEPAMPPAAPPPPAKPRVEPPAAPPAPPAADVLPPAAPTAPLPRAVLENAPPRGRVGASGASRPAVQPREAPPPPPPPVVARTEPSPLVHPVAPLPAEPAEEVVDAVPTRAPPGAPRVQVTFLVYSRVPERRTVALSINGGGMVTLREGEAAADVEVERIMPDRVHLRHGGTVYAVRARD